MAGKSVEFHYGVLSDPIEMQANEQGLTLGKKAELYEVLCDAMITCWILGIVTDAEKNKMIARFQKKMIKDLSPIEEVEG